MNLEAQVRQGLTGLGLDLPAASQQRLVQYLALLLKWNRTYNLTAIREPSKLVSYHLLDSLAVLPHLSGTSVADIGSGAGLPGIPLAVARPDWRVVLLDSNHKKAAFLRQAVLELELDNVQVVSDRAEKWQPAQRFDCVISRAFSDLPGFVEVACHLCAPAGRLVAMKGIYPDEELAQLGAQTELERVVVLQVPGLRAERHLVLLRPTSLLLRPTSPGQEQSSGAQ
jgi:16S rRNA (guanine527-N7)-methyltransferase